jgi:hypothetical protein
VASSFVKFKSIVSKGKNIEWKKFLLFKTKNGKAAAFSEAFQFLHKTDKQHFK